MSKSRIAFVVVGLALAVALWLLLSGGGPSTGARDKREPETITSELTLGAQRTIELPFSGHSVRLMFRVPVGWVRRQDRPVTFAQPSMPSPDVYDWPRLTIEVACDGDCVQDQIAQRIRELPEQLLQRSAAMTVYPPSDPRSMKVAATALDSGSIERGADLKSGTFAVVEVVAPKDKLGSGVLDVSRLEGECAVPAPDLKSYARIRFIVPRAWKGPRLDTMVTACKSLTFVE